MDKPEVVEFIGGKFTLGGTKQQIEVKPFAMAIYPVTNQEYKKFDSHHKHCYVSDQYVSDQDDQPVVNVSWEDAVRYCQWLSNQTNEHYRLPTEAEWEFAASGGGQRQYPWGNEEPSPERANYFDSHINKITPVGTYPLGKTPEGLFDMAGNVWEWCQDWYDQKQCSRVVHGGSFLNIQVNLHCTARDWLISHDWSDLIGFRVVRSFS